MCKKWFFVGLVAMCLIVVTDSNATVVGQWSFTEGSGTIAADSSGNEHDISGIGTGTGAGYSWTTGVTGSGVRAALNTDSYLVADIGGLLTNVSQWSIDLWVKPSNVETDGSYIVGFTGHSFLRIDGGKTAVAFGVFNGAEWLQSQATVATEASPIGSDGLWHHLTGVFDGVNGNIIVSWDNVSVTSTFDVSGGPAVVNLGQMVIGGIPWAPSYATANYNGSIDDITLSVVPEPTTILLMSIGCAFLRRKLV